MATVDKEIADRIVAGEYPEDGATRIVEYDNAFGGVGYGVTFERDNIDKYMTETPYIGNPRIYWDREAATESEPKESMDLLTALNMVEIAYELLCDFQDVINDQLEGDHPAWVGVSEWLERYEDYRP